MGRTGRIDLEHDQRPPPTWNIPWVLVRVVELYAVERRLPHTDRTGNGSAWLFPVKHEFSEIVGWHDARERVWEAWARASGVWPWELSRADEVAGWLNDILADHAGERRCLAVFGKCRAYHVPTSKVCKLRGWSRATFFRKVNMGAGRMAAILNNRRVIVR